MTTANQVRLCPKCDRELASQGDCPYCGNILAHQNKFFDPPDYIWRQREDLLDECDPSRSTAKTKADKPRAVVEINASFVAWFRECPFADKLAAMRDAQMVVQHLMHMKLDVNEIKQIVVIAKSLGRLAEAYENVFRHGGTLHNGQVGQIPPDAERTLGSNEAIG